MMPQTRPVLPFLSTFDTDFLFPLQTGTIRRGLTSALPESYGQTGMFRNTRHQVKHSIMLAAFAAGQDHHNACDKAHRSLIAQPAMLPP